MDSNGSHALWLQLVVRIERDHVISIKMNNRTKNFYTQREELESVYGEN